MGWGQRTPFSLYTSSARGGMLSRDRSEIVNTKKYAHRFFFYSFIASDGSEGTITGRVVSSCSIMVHHGVRSQQASSARKESIDYAKQHHTPHCWLPAKLMYPSNSTKRFYWLTRSTANLLLENVQIYIYI